MWCQITKVSSLYRTHLNSLENWFNKPNRKPLILRGARQVGKSTLVRLFAQQKNISLAEVNLERHLNLSNLFKTNQPIEIINSLEVLPNVNSIEADSLLFFDEIQAVPEAIPSLRYFYEDMAQLALISAGSLLEFTLSDHTFSMPVGRVEYLHMGPMTFTEFLDAIGENKLSLLIRSFKLADEINSVIHSRFMTLLRVYFFVGGMPEAVKVYRDTKSFSQVSRVHHSIIDTYRDDFPKYIGSRNLPRMQHVFNFAARNVGKKIKYSQFSSEDKSATIKKDIELLCMARLLSKVTHSHASGLPLQADLEEKVYKLIFMDVGLMNVVCGLGWQNISSPSDKQLVNAGAVAEQFIGQHLLEILSSSSNRDLTYWLREGRANNAEVDYVIALNGKILPIEIKSGATGSLKSLNQFMAEKKLNTAVRFDAGQPSIQTIATKARKKNKDIDVHYRLVSLPLYLVERLPDLF